jgi:type II secretory pathway component GspD/PulD (secretin)
VNPNHIAIRRSIMKLVQSTLGIMLALAFCARDMRAQSSPPTPVPDVTQTFYLANVGEHNEVGEILTAIRNMVSPSARIYLVPSQNAILMTAAPDQILVAEKILHDLDRPRKTYRLTYTIAEKDQNKTIGIQHYAMIVVSGQRTTLKQGNRVPVETGSYSSGPSGTQTSISYLDVGLNFDATLDESANGVRLRTKAEQSSIADEKSGVGAADPILRQTLLEGTSILTPGKPLTLGSVDVPGSTRHLDIEVVMEVVH